MGRQRRAQPSAPEVALDEQKRVLKKKRSKKRKGHRGREADLSNRVGRYQQALKEKADKDEVALYIATTRADDFSYSFNSAPGDGGRAAGGGAGSASGAGPLRLPSGLTSLDVHIPMRGILYQFTTPRGDVKITARAVSRPFLANLARWAIVFAVIVVLWRGYKFVVQERFVETYGRGISMVLIIAGIVSVLTGVLPLAGAVALIVGGVSRFGMRKSWQPQ